MIKNHAYGALIGALLGDAIGAPLEFLGHKPTEKEIISAMDLTGGGYWKVAPGQITDDGELILTLANSITKEESFNSKKVLQNYMQWYNSKPFDIGNTTITAFGYPVTYSLKDHLAYVKRNSLKSKANGSLMRAIPLAIWGYKLSEKELTLLAFEDSRLSHPNKSCCEAVGAYLIAVASLIKSEGDRDYALKRVNNWARRHYSQEVKMWLTMAQDSIMANPFYPNSGFIKIAFINSFRMLFEKIDFNQSIKDTITAGGDTDTNASIAGGLMGAYKGVDNIKQKDIDNLLNSDSSKGRLRPSQYHPSNALTIVDNLLNLAPSKLPLLFSFKNFLS